MDEKKPKVRAKPKASRQNPAGADAAAVTERATLKGEWKAMGPLSKFMTILGLIGFIVGIPGWVTKEYWLGKEPANVTIPPSITEQLKPEQIELLNEALKNLDSRAGETGTPESQVELALQAAERGNLKLAEGLLEEVYRNSAASVAGAQTEQALAARHLAALAIVTDSSKALTLYRQSTELEPANRDGWIGRGDAALKAGTLEEAEDAFRRFVALTPAETDPLKHAAGQDRLGDVMLAKGDLDNAFSAFSGALAISQKLLETDKANVGLQRNVAVSITKLGDVEAAKGDIEKALSTFQDGITLARGILDASKGKSGARDLSVFLNRAGDMEMRLGNADSALAAYSDSLNAIQKLSTENPQDISILRDVSVALMNIGNLKAATKNEREALTFYTQAFAIRDEMVGRDPANAEWQRELAVTLLRTGDMKTQTGDLGGAIGNYDQALAILRRLSSLDPASLSLRRDLSAVLTARANGAVKAADQSGAAAFYAEAKTILDSLSLTQPELAELKRDRIVLAARMADAGIDPAQNLRIALQQAQTMQAEGTLGAGDAWMIEDLETRLSKVSP